MIHRKLEGLVAAGQRANRGRLISVKSLYADDSWAYGQLLYHGRGA